MVKEIIDIKWFYYREEDKNIRVIYENGEDVLYYMRGNRHNHYVIRHDKEELYKGRNNYGWNGVDTVDLSSWSQKIGIELKSKGITNKILYDIIKEIFALKGNVLDYTGDPSNKDEKIVEKIIDVLSKHIGNIIFDKNKTIHHYKGVQDIIMFFLTAYSIHYSDCVRTSMTNNKMYNTIKTVKYPYVVMRTMIIKSSGQAFASSDVSTDTAALFYRGYEKVETEDDAINRVGNTIISGIIHIEANLIGNGISKERENEIKDNIVKEMKNSIEKAEREKIKDIKEEKIYSIEKAEREKIKDIKEEKIYSINKCWACEKDVSSKELIKIYRPLGLDTKTEEMECPECAKLPDDEYIKKMDEKWNKKINGEVNKEFDDDINKEIEREFEKEIEKENITDGN